MLATPPDSSRSAGPVKLLRHLSALLSAGLIWGVLWVALGILAGTIIGIVDPHEIDPGEEPVVLAPMIGLVGFICGVAFGALLSTAKKAEPFYSLPSSRAAMVGILVAAALPIVAGKGLPEMLVTVPLGAVSAMASVAILRKWPALPATR